MSERETIDLSYLKQVRALARPGGPDVLQLVTASFLTQSALILDSIENALQKGDFGRAGELAHKLKSSSGNLGAKPLFALLDRFETLAVGSPLQLRQALFEEIRDECEKVRALLKDGAPA